MRWLVLSVLTLCVFEAGAAPADIEKRDYSKSLNQENKRFLQELVKLVEAQGYRGVRVIPQLFITTAKGENGEDSTLIINSDTLEVIPFAGKLPLGQSQAPETELPGLH